MKRRRKWFPSLAQLETYESLLNEQNKVRRAILRKRAKVERETKGRRTIPDLVVPKKAKIKKLKTYRFKSYRDYQAKIRELKRMFGRGLESYYKETYKKNILEAYRDMIRVAMEENGQYYSDFEPRGRGGYYSKEQIEEAGEIGKYMKLYNQFVNMTPSKFQDMYDRGYITELRYIYAEMIGGGMKSRGISFLEEQKENIAIYNKIYRDTV